MTTHDVHRAMEENLFTSFHHRHNPLKTSTILGPRSTTGYSTMSASELITMSSRQQPHRSNRPNSDMLRTAPGLRGHHTAEAEAIDKMYEDIQRYEKMMDEAAAASLDQDFKDELEHVNQWFLCRSDPERTAALYTLVQNASQIQIRFLITVLQQRADPLGEMHSPAGQDKGPAPVTVAGSVVSTESQYEMRKRQMYPPSRRGTRSNLCNRLTSALSEPDDLRRRDLLVPLGGNLSQQGLLYEKALAARAQFQAANRAVSNSASSTNGSTSSSFSPRTSTSDRTSLFGNDWPFHLARDRDEWTFGSLSSSNNDNNNSTSNTSSKKWTRKSATIKEEHQKEHHSMLSSMAALEQAQARLRQSKAVAAAQVAVTHHHQQHLSPQPRIPRSNVGINTLNNSNAIASPTPVTPAAPLSGANGANTIPLVSGATTSAAGTRSPLPPPGLSAMVAEKKLASSTQQPQSPQLQPAAPTMPHHQQQQQQQQTPQEQPQQVEDLQNTRPSGQFLSPPSVHFEIENTDYLSDQSDASNKDQTLTGAARRRKRSSAARALKDKIAAETIDFDLMKDVQNWLRSLRLHKYSPAFDGLVWQQVIQMTDEDMLRAGVNTLGARRKLVKVFENVMNHCDENGIEYKNIAGTADAEQPK